MGNLRNRVGKVLAKIEKEYPDDTIRLMETGEDGGDIIINMYRPDLISTYNFNSFRIKITRKEIFFKSIDKITNEIFNYVNVYFTINSLNVFNFVS